MLLKSWITFAGSYTRSVVDELSLLLDSLCWTCYFYFLFDNSCARVVFVFFSAAVIAWSTVCKFSLATWFSMACCCTPMQIVAKDDTSMAHPATGLPWLISQDTSVVAQLVHRVRLDDVHAKLAMRPVSYTHLTLPTKA